MRLLMGLKRFGAVLLIFVGATAGAAQVGKVIVDEASLREYPQEGSKVLATVSRDETVTVSNQPTSGYYKARLATGQMGWLSGNDIFVKGTQRSSMTNRIGSGVASPRSAFSRRPKPDSVRVLAGYGISSLGYGGLKGAFDTSALSPMAFSLEAQFRMSHNLYWAIRAQYHFANGDSSLSAATTQNIKTKLLPVMLGLNYSLVRSESFRLGLGVYLGLSVQSTTAVTWTSASTVQNLEYSSLDLMGNGSLQVVYYFLKSMGLVLDLGYHYQKTGEFSGSTEFSKPALAIDYSGLTARAGIEFLF